MTYTHRRKKKKSPIRGLLPVMGLLLAVLLGLVAYFLAPAVVDWARDQENKIGDVVSDIERDIPNDLPENTLDYLVAGVLWILMFGISMAVVAGAIGPDPEKLAFKDMPVPPSNKNAMIKQMKKDLKTAKRRERERSRRD